MSSTGRERALLKKNTIAVWLGIALLLIIVPADIIWLFERRHPHGPALLPPHFPRHVVGREYARDASRANGSHWFARVVAILWMFIGVVFVAY